MVRWLALGAALVCGTACKTHWTAEVTQPALQLEAGKVGRTSWPLAIVLRDMEMRYVPLANTAYYVAVSRDRLRFHVTLLHKWESMSDLRTWQAWVEDDSGAHHALEELQQQITQIGFEQVGLVRTALRNFARVQQVPIYRGVADFTIYSRDVSAARRVILVLRRPGYEYRYVWRSEAPET